jgi:IMP dehydrogenase
VAGVGVPQITAVDLVTQALEGTGVPLIADGGLRYSGDIAKVIAAGAHSVMIGGLFAGTDEVPRRGGAVSGPLLQVLPRHGLPGRHGRQAGLQRPLLPGGHHRGGQAGAGRDRGPGALQGERVNIIYQLMGGLRSSMGYTGCASIQEMRTKPQFVRVTNAGMRESHVHDVQITKEAPNYRRDASDACPRAA